MKTAFIGSRSISDYNLIRVGLDSLEITEIISGGATGVDALAYEYSKERNLPITIIKPDWKEYGKSAGVIRDIEIVKNAELVVAFWDGKSKGTLDSIKKAKKYNKELIIFINGVLDEKYSTWYRSRLF